MKIEKEKEKRKEKGDYSTNLGIIHGNPSINNCQTKNCIGKPPEELLDEITFNFPLSQNPQRKYLTHQTINGIPHVCLQK